MQSEEETKLFNALRVGALRLVAYGGYAYTYAVRFNDGETVYPELWFKADKDYTVFADKCSHENIVRIYTVYHNEAKTYLG